MNKLAFLIILAVLYSPAAGATSLDEIYRDLIKSDNQGYLPLFVKNRKAPDILVDDGITKIPEVPATIDPKISPYEIPFFDKYKLEAEAKAEARRKWDNAVNAVRENRVTPIELDEILRHVAANEPQAVEIFAWMNTRGVGVNQDLIRAFDLYRQAIYLKVPNAEKNAAIVYRSLTPNQKKLIKAYNPPEEETTQGMPDS